MCLEVTWRLNEIRYEIVRSSGGSEFQSEGATTANDRSAIVFLVTRLNWDEETTTIASQIKLGRRL